MIIVNIVDIYFILTLYDCHNVHHLVLKDGDELCSLYKGIFQVEMRLCCCFYVLVRIHALEKGKQSVLCMFFSVFLYNSVL